MDKLWILNADETRGRIFKTDEFIGELEEYIDMVHPEARLSESDLAHHSRGRSRDSDVSKGHGLNQQGALKEHQAEVFAKEVADKLIQSDSQHLFRYLIIVAPPKFLGLLRKKLNVNVLEKIHMEINKELSHLSTHEFKQHLEKIAM